MKDLSGPAVPFFEFRSQYRIGDIISPAQARDRTLFCVLYVGRIEKSKGVLDIPAIAQQVGNQINFDICGGGGALVELKQIVAEQKLGNVFVHGRVSRSELLDKFSKAHAIISCQHEALFVKVCLPFALKQCRLDCQSSLAD